MITCSRCGHEYEDTLKLALEGRPVCPTCMHELTASVSADGRPAPGWRKDPPDVSDFAMPKDPPNVSDFAMPKDSPEPRFFHFDTDVYERRIGLAVGPLKEMGAAWLTEQLRKAWPDLDQEGHVELDDTDATVFADALRIQTENGGVIRIVRIPRFDPGSQCDHAVLAHETFHLVCGTLKDLGIPHDDHEEAHAYLFEYVYRVFLDFLYGRGPSK